jgi:hypothetical protein|tara:strand:+ start:1730 stop:3685 length:1956 start_codon:yes stop_codon:yes gene_type:complete
MQAIKLNKSQGASMFKAMGMALKPTEKLLQQQKVLLTHLTRNSYKSAEEKLESGKAEKLKAAEEKKQSGFLYQLVTKNKILEKAGKNTMKWMGEKWKLLLGLGLFLLPKSFWTGLKDLINKVILELPDIIDSIKDGTFLDDYGEKLGGIIGKGFALYLAGSAFKDIVLPALGTIFSTAISTILLKKTIENTIKKNLPAGDVPVGDVVDDKTKKTTDGKKKKPKGKIRKLTKFLGPVGVAIAAADIISGALDKTEQTVEPGDIKGANIDKNDASRTPLTKKVTESLETSATFAANIAKGLVSTTFGVFGDITELVGIRPDWLATSDELEKVLDNAHNDLEKTYVSSVKKLGKSLKKTVDDISEVHILDPIIVTKSKYIPPPSTDPNINRLNEEKDQKNWIDMMGDWGDKKYKEWGLASIGNDLIEWQKIDKSPNLNMVKHETRESSITGMSDSSRNKANIVAGLFAGGVDMTSGWRSKENNRQAMIDRTTALGGDASGKGGYRLASKLSKEERNAPAGSKLREEAVDKLLAMPDFGGAHVHGNAMDIRYPKGFTKANFSQLKDIIVGTLPGAKVIAEKDHVHIAFNPAVPPMDKSNAFNAQQNMNNELKGSGTGGPQTIVIDKSQNNTSGGNTTTMAVSPSATDGKQILNKT